MGGYLIMSSTVFRTIMVSVALSLNSTPEEVDPSFDPPFLTCCHSEERVVWGTGGLGLAH